MQMVHFFAKAGTQLNPQNDDVKTRSATSDNGVVNMVCTVFTTVSVTVSDTVCTVCTVFTTVSVS